MGQHTAIPRTNDDTAGSSLSSDNTQSLSVPAGNSVHCGVSLCIYRAGRHQSLCDLGAEGKQPGGFADPAEHRRIGDYALSDLAGQRAGNALPLTAVDPKTRISVTFTDLTMAKGETSPESLNGDTLQANLIMPEPTHFIDPSLGPVAIIRPTSTTNSGAVAAIQSFQDDGLSPLGRGTTSWVFLTVWPCRRILLFGSFS